MWLKAVVRHFRDHLTVAVFLVLSAVLSAGCDNRETILMIEKPTEVRSIEQSPSSPESSGTNLQPGKVIATLRAGETARTIGVYHGQDHDAFQVKLSDGREGLVITEIRVRELFRCRRQLAGKSDGD
jgi:hypothetical protein